MMAFRAHTYNPDFQPAQEVRTSDIIIKNAVP